MFAISVVPVSTVRAESSRTSKETSPPKPG